MEKIIVRVPASTSNLGPGFDCLGVALNIHNSITLVRGGKTQHLPPIVDEAARLFFKQTRARPFAFSAAVEGDVPLSRGLGSSATARVGILFGLNELCGRRLDKTSTFRLVAQLEGHPDNAAPACFGGFTVVRRGHAGTAPAIQRFIVARALLFVLLVPEYEVETRRARDVLPAKVSRVAAVENSANACGITAAFASRQYTQLRGAFADHLHQPFRAKLNPLLPRVLAAAGKAGALGAFLSGSGSTICAVTLQNADRIAAAMRRAAGSRPARTMITTADNRGVKIRHSSVAIRH